MPNAREVMREALTVLAGAVVAAIIIGQVPPLRAWIKAQWAGEGGCACR